MAYFPAKLEVDHRRFSWARLETSLRDRRGWPTFRRSGTSTNKIFFFSFFFFFFLFFFGFFDDPCSPTNHFSTCSIHSKVLTSEWIDGIQLAKSPPEVGTETCSTPAGGRVCVGGCVCVCVGLAAPYYLNVSHLTGIVFVAHHAILVTRISDHGRFSSFPRFRVVGTLLECGGANTN